MVVVRRCLRRVFLEIVFRGEGSGVVVGMFDPVACRYASLSRSGVDGFAGKSTGLKGRVGVVCRTGLRGCLCPSALRGWQRYVVGEQGVAETRCVGEQVVHPSIGHTRGMGGGLRRYERPPHQPYPLSPAKCPGLLHLVNPHHPLKLNHVSLDRHSVHLATLTFRTGSTCQNRTTRRQHHPIDLITDRIDDAFDLVRHALIVMRSPLRWKG